jgi:hypothetical protein
MGIVQRYFRSYFEHGISLPRLTAFVFFILMPIVSIVFRLRKQRIAAPATNSDSANRAAADVRRRLVGQKQTGLLRSFWIEVVNAIGDTIRMGGRGLV